MLDKLKDEDNAVKEYAHGGRAQGYGMYQTTS